MTYKEALEHIANPDNWDQCPCGYHHLLPLNEDAMDFAYNVLKENENGEVDH